MRRAWGFTPICVCARACVWAGLTSQGSMPCHSSATLPPHAPARLLPLCVTCCPRLSGALLYGRYGISKLALSMYTRNVLAPSLKDKGVVVSACCPG